MKGSSLSRERTSYIHIIFQTVSPLFVNKRKMYLKTMDRVKDAVIINIQQYKKRNFRHIPLHLYLIVM